MNELNAGEADMRKYVDDTTISEVVYKGHDRCIQQVVDDLAMKARDDGFHFQTKGNAKNSGLASQEQTRI